MYRENEKYSHSFISMLNHTLRVYHYPTAEEILDAFISRKLNQRLSNKIEKHLRKCDSCANLFINLKPNKQNSQARKEYFNKWVVCLVFEILHLTPIEELMDNAILGRINESSADFQTLRMHLLSCKKCENEFKERVPFIRNLCSAIDLMESRAV